MLEQDVVTSILEELVSNGKTGRAFRRFLADSGPLGKNAILLANENTRNAITYTIRRYDIPFNKECNVRPRTYKMLFESMSYQNDTLIQIINCDKNATLGAKLALKHLKPYKALYSKPIEP